MLEFRHLTPSDARRQPWKNGRGVTEELALWPPGATFERGDLDWRIACAAVDEPGPFSAFPGFERVLVITRGAGLRLEHGPAAAPARVLPLQPYRFSGDWTTDASLIDGPVSDFNVLARRGVVRAEVRVLRAESRVLRERVGAAHTFAHLIDGDVRLRLDAAPGIALAPRESVWLRGAEEGSALEITGGGTLIVVRIDEASDARRA
jgi:environmental stress-induced protein Ves